LKVSAFLMYAYSVTTKELRGNLIPLIISKYALHSIIFYCNFTFVCFISVNGNLDKCNSPLLLLVS